MRLVAGADCCWLGVAQPMFMSISMTVSMTVTMAIAMAMAMTVAMAVAVAVAVAMPMAIGAYKPGAMQYEHHAAGNRKTFDIYI